MSPVAATLQRLDANDPATIEHYERLIYRSFSVVEKQALLRRLWSWDDADKRIRTRIPYSDQRLYYMAGERGVTTGLSVNVALHRQQCATFGFQIPSDAPQPVEFLAMFSLPAQDLRAWCELTAAVWQDLAKDGYRSGWATTAPKPLPFYRRMGATLRDSAVIDGEERLLFSFDISQPPWSTARQKR